MSPHGKQSKEEPAKDRATMMSPLRVLGSLLASSRHRICARSASLLRRRRLPHGGHQATAATGAALSAAALVGVGGIALYNSRADDDDDYEHDNDDAEKSPPAAGRSPVHRHHEVLEEDETVEEKAMKMRFEEWMIKYRRRYKDEQEKAMRYEIFKSTAQRVDELNARPGALCTFGTTQFADETEESSSRCYGGVLVPDDELRRRRSIDR